ncbi:MAG: carbon starvation protein A [Candidatus Omnitrophica bacterium]|nr:carbon starvation protein A [Candidatus Omnitrophota bacterium]
MIYQIVLIAIVFFLLAFRFYGFFLAKRFTSGDASPTPACEINDGIDYIPAKPSLLLGQHFSAIAAAGPIVGPILACLWFGWLPALLWVVLGSVFIGGIHDFGSLMASLRHKASSIGEVVKVYMPKAHKFFLIFVWLALLYVIIAFTDITAHTFKTALSGEAFGPAVAGSSILYLASAIVLGVLLYRFKIKLWLATMIFLPLMLFIIWAGPHLPKQLLNLLAGISIKQWDVIILFYCLAASLAPLWLLLQPRGYLGGWFLYLVIIIGLAGALFGGFRIEYPAVNLEGFNSALNAKAIFPVLFITVACGACSGFHGIVASGTTSKQIYHFRDSLPVAYGAMLLEGLVAVLAIATVVMLPKGAEALKADPNLIYARGIAGYLGLLKVNYSIALSFALLAFSTFVYDTLDVCMRLARYVFQELSGLKTKLGIFFAAFINLLIPFVFLMSTKEKGYLVAWPIFGTSNQLLAGLILLVISVWLFKSGKNPVYTVLPMLFMMIMSVWSLLNMVISFIRAIPEILKGSAGTDIFISGICAIALLVLSMMLCYEAVRVFLSCKNGGLKADL